MATVTLSQELTCAQAIGKALVEIMKDDSNVFLIGEGVDNITGVYGITLPAFRKFGPKRVIDSPLSENGLTGICIGAAMSGLRPVLFHQRNDFMMLTMDQLVNHAAKINFVSNGRHKVPLTVVSFIARKAGEGVQHSQSLQALFAHIPGLKVVMPSNPHNAMALLLGAIEDENPVIVLYHRDLLSETYNPVFRSISVNELKVPPGKAELVRSGLDVTVVASSVAVRDTRYAADILEADDVDVEIIDLVSIRPLDKKLILGSVRKTGRVLIVDTGWKEFGVSAEVAAIISEEIGNLKCLIRRIGMLETPCPASPYLLKGYHTDTQKIVTTIREMMK